MKIKVVNSDSVIVNYVFDNEWTVSATTVDEFRSDVMIWNKAGRNVLFAQDSDGIPFDIELYNVWDDRLVQILNMVRVLTADADPVLLGKRISLGMSIHSVLDV